MHTLAALSLQGNQKAEEFDIFVIGAWVLGWCERNW